MENNKYYTPELSEFYIGFEYELYTSFDEWLKCKLDYISLLNLLDISTRCRTKYLDEQDIKELGWVYDNNDEPYPSLYEVYGQSKSYTIDKQLTNLETCWILHFFENNIITIERIVKCGSGKWDVLFNGSIKNKSELLKLMQQLQII